MRVQLDHLQPTAVGATVAAEAVLEKVEGRRLLFTVSVRDHRGLVACGKVTRVIVDAERFLDKLSLGHPPTAMAVGPRPDLQIARLLCASAQPARIGAEMKAPLVKLAPTWGPEGDRRVESVQER